MRQPTEREQFFLDRVGKVVYRNDNGCPCKMCQSGFLYGILINDRLAALYLYDTECEYNAEGNPLRYFDTKEEATEFSVNQEK